MKRILFVDDESNILDGLRRILYPERTHWDIHFALGAEAALIACEARGFDVVISDMRMPGMDGVTLLSHIRDRFPDTARIALSGYSEPGLTARVVSLAHRFLSKPCSALELHQAIKQVLSLQDTLRAPEIRRVVGSVGELPSLSSTYTSLMKAATDPYTSINQLAAIIEKDVAMSAKVLQLANSAFFGLAREASSLQSAATYLGTATIKNLALASEAFRAFAPTPPVPRPICEAIQRHSQETAAIAGMLPIERGIHDITIVAALLHDIGRLFLATKMPDEFCAIQSLSRMRACKVFEAEEEILGTSHAEIGAYLLGLWGIPNLAIEAIAHHHHPTRIPHSGFDSTVAVYVADLLAHELDVQPRGASGLEVEAANRDSLEALGVWELLPALRTHAFQCRGGVH